MLHRHRRLGGAETQAHLAGGRRRDERGVHTGSDSDGARAARGGGQAAALSSSNELKQRNYIKMITPSCSHH